MQLPSDQETRDIFVTLFRSSSHGQKFNPVELAKELNLQNADTVAVATALSLLTYYCTRFSPTKWQMRPMVVEKFNKGYYKQFGIL